MNPPARDLTTSNELKTYSIVLLVVFILCNVYLGTSTIDIRNLNYTLFCLDFFKFLFTFWFSLFFLFSSCFWMVNVSETGSIMALMGRSSWWMSFAFTKKRTLIKIPSWLNVDVFLLLLWSCSTVHSLHWTLTEYNLFYMLTRNKTTSQHRTEFHFFCKKQREKIRWNLQSRVD